MVIFKLSEAFIGEIHKNKKKVRKCLKTMTSLRKLNEQKRC